MVTGTVRENDDGDCGRRRHGMPGLAITLCGISLRNPLILASGISGTTVGALRLAVAGGAGAVTIKTITKEARKGHSPPIMAAFDAGLLNAVGYPNMGIDAAEGEFKDLTSVGAPVIGSATGKDAGEFAELVSRLDKLPFAAIELVLSCPHTPGFGTLAGHSTPEATREITAACRQVTRKPLFVKLSPNVPAIGEVAKAAQDAGADAITAVNTMGPGMLLESCSGQPQLSFGCGGVSGPALRPVALRCVYDLATAVTIPIIGTGGVSTGEHAINMLQVGASAVGVGTAVLDDINCFTRIAQEMDAWLTKQGRTLSDAQGMTLRELKGDGP